jgi:hypothetical protein
MIFDLCFAWLGDMKGKWGPSPQDTVDKANVQLDNLADILGKRGIRVDRPTLLDFSQPAKTPYFETQSLFGCMPPRDVIATVGNEMIEAAQPAHENPPPMCYSSVWLSMNVLVLDPKTVCVE